MGFQLNDEIDTLPGVGKVYSHKLRDLGIFTLSDLLSWYPRYHLTYTPTLVSEAGVGDMVIIEGALSSIETNRRGRLSTQKAYLTDSSGRITLRWFNQPYLTRTLKPHLKYRFTGSVSEFNGWKQVVNPHILSPNEEVSGSQLVPVYSEGNAIPTSWFRTKILHILQNLDRVPETISPKIRSSYKLLNRLEALRQIHFPKNSAELEDARYRLSFEELMSLFLDSFTKRVPESAKAPVVKAQEPHLTDFKNSLPFTLTPSQEKALSEILFDLEKPTPMNRLLQGEVGSGKTVVALAAAYLTHVHGLRSVLMAPTQVLAKQLYDTATFLLNPLKVTCQLLTGKHKPSGNFDILVGTHAVLNATHPIPQLGLVIVDEQHKFGVKQREKLRGQSNLTPHQLTMTATPIPRSLALTIYGDLNLSNITDKPSGRLPVKTFLVGEEKRQPAYTWIREQIVKSGYQVFIVSPLIEESESSELKHLKSAKSEYDKIRRLFPKQNVGLIHGKLKEEEKLAVIDRFRKHETDILVSTTVVEVGIDVPEANIILIESAERFGLAQLHQLRGRVGRSTKQGYCLLFPTTPTPKAQERLSLFTSTTDGAKLAEIDMKLRGPGELYGIEQHGFFSLKLANIWDFDLLEKAKSAAQMQLAINALQD